MKYFEQVKIKGKRVQGFHYSRNMGEGGINPVKSPRFMLAMGKYYPPPWLSSPKDFNSIPPSNIVSSLKKLFWT